jgi:hypothetical protein
VIFAKKLDPLLHGLVLASGFDNQLSERKEEAPSIVHATDRVKEMFKLCTVKNTTQIMVCDVSRDEVKRAVSDQFGNAVTFETAHGGGTLVTCLDPSRTIEFQQSVSDALSWTEDRWASAG